MKRPKTLSASFAKTVRQPGRYGDGRGGHGLSLLVKTTNIQGRFSKTWSQRIRINGRETNLGLGSYPAVTLAEARRRALRNRQSVEEGHNPRSGRTPTFQQAAAKVIELHSGKWRPGSRSRNIWESSLKTHVFPHIGRKQVNEVTSKDIMKCLSPIWHSKPETARRVQQRISAIMKWAIAEGFLESDPSAAILAGLGKNSTRRSHMRALHHSHVSAAIKTVEASNAHWATIAAFKILTLTATRSGEVRNATWNEIDLTTGHMGNTRRTNQNRPPASGTPKQTGTEHHRQCCRPHRHNRAGIPITHRKATIQLNHFQTGPRKRNRSRSTRNAIILP